MRWAWLDSVRAAPELAAREAREQQVRSVVDWWAFGDNVRTGNAAARPAERAELQRRSVVDWWAWWDEVRTAISESDGADLLAALEVVAM